MNQPTQFPVHVDEREENNADPSRVQRFLQSLGVAFECTDNPEGRVITIPEESWDKVTEAVREVGRENAEYVIDASVHAGDETPALEDFDLEDYEYPDDLEEDVRDAWRNFVQDQLVKESEGQHRQVAPLEDVDADLNAFGAMLKDPLWSSYNDAVCARVEEYADDQAEHQANQAREDFEREAAGPTI